MKMTDETITSMALCSQCENFQWFMEDVTACELGRVKEFQADGGLTECEYWEAKR